MKVMTLFFGLSLAACLPLSAMALDKQVSVSDLAVEATSNLNSQAALARANAPINSQTALSAYLASPAAKRPPLSLLSSNSKSRFLTSLQFNESGVTSFYYADIERELTATQAYDLLSLFGLQSTLSQMKNLSTPTAADKKVVTAYPSISPMMIADHSDYWCSSRATCSHSTGSICMSGC